MNDDHFCPACGGEPVSLGAMGGLAHLRCRACGWTFAVETSAETDALEESEDD